jgi:PhnB protein
MHSHAARARIHAAKYDATFFPFTRVSHTQRTNCLVMQMNPYLSFKGDCEAAFKFYEDCFGAQLGAIFRYAGSPAEHQVPADWSEKIMHGSITIGDQVLMGADVTPERYEEPKGFSLSLQIKSTGDAERIFNELARDGRVVMPLAKTFWASRFGVVVDRFGIQWLINCEGSDESPEA